MTYRHQIPACGWKAVIEHENGSYSTIPLVCFEILCAADEEEEEDYAYYEPEILDHRAKPKKGSAIEAVGLAFIEGHPSRKPTLILQEVHTINGFIGYLAPGEDEGAWLAALPPEEKTP